MKINPLPPAALLGAAVLLAWSCASAPAPTPAQAPAAANLLGTAAFSGGTLAAEGLEFAPLTAYQLTVTTAAPRPLCLRVEAAGTQGQLWVPAGPGSEVYWFATGAEGGPGRLQVTAPAGADLGAATARLEAVGPLLTDRAGKDPTSWQASPLGVNLPDLTGRGATLPYLSYEAEAMTHRGKLVGPSRRTLDSGADLGAEASGRAGVDLVAAGDYVEFTARQATNSLVVRYALNDGRGGKGIQAPLGLWVDGVYRQDLTLTSEYVVVYGNFPWKNDPSLGNPRHYYDEVRALVKEIPAGSRVRLQRPAASQAKVCVIDLVDTEEVAPPLPMPEGFLSVTDFGAVPNDHRADNKAIEACIAAAKKQKAAGVWFPAGTFDLSEELYPDLVIRGAGMWYTTLHAVDIGFQGIKKTFEIHDLSVTADIKERNDSLASAGYQGIAGPGSLIENVWITHTKVGLWTEKGTNGLTLRGCRVRDTMADGINLYRGTKNCLIENNNFRGTGDDAIALWSSTEASNTEPDSGNVVRNNTIQCPWLANGIAVYGGRDNRIENNLVFDTGLNGAGIDISSRFEPVPFSGVLTVKDNVLVRCGSYEGDGGWHGALWIDGRNQGIPGAIRISGLEVYDATISGITIQGPGETTDLSLDGVKVDGASAWAIKLYPNASGTLKIAHFEAAHTLSGVMKNQSSLALTLGEGTSGL